jgi:hypothetical protein
MAFDKSAWAIDGSHANINIPRTHRYKTADAAGTVETANYFDAVYNEVEIGDCIDALVDGAAIRYVVTAKAAGVISIEDPLAE